MAGEVQTYIATAGFTPLERFTGMFFVLFLILLTVWLLGCAAFHVAGGLIPLLLILAVISIVVHFVKRQRAV